MSHIASTDRNSRYASVLILAVVLLSCLRLVVSAQAQPAGTLSPGPDNPTSPVHHGGSETSGRGDAPVPNVVFILSDDHRYDFMGFHPNAPEFLETPNLDRLAKQGAHLANAFVSTSLCSPSRASILTGQYMHHHRVVDNQNPVPKGTVFFPQYLQKAGIATALVGKWHMGHDNDQPRPGFDHWVSFKGQGSYFDPLLNINGQRKQFQGYAADVLTDQALDWLKKDRPPQQRFFLYLSYKAVHYPFQPAPRHHGRYEDKKIDYPETMANTNRAGSASAAIRSTASTTWKRDDLTKILFRISTTSIIVTTKPSTDWMKTLDESFLTSTSRDFPKTRW